MSGLKKILIALLFPTFLTATYFGNPALPALQIDGVFKEPPSWYCLRVGYMADRLYRQSYQDEFKIDPITNHTNYAQLSTEAATIILDFKNSFDITVLIGNAQLQLDQELFSKRQFAWGLGAKWLIYQTSALYLGFDMKYFESKQKPLYLISDGAAYNVISDFKLDYLEMQAAFGTAYRIGVLSPYLYLTYLYSKIEPNPYSLIVRLPTDHLSVDTSSRSVIGKRRWGMAVGGTIIGGTKGSVSIESRFFNQNALNISGEIRF